MSPSNFYINPWSYADGQVVLRLPFQPTSPPSPIIPEDANAYLHMWTTGSTYPSNGIIDTFNNTWYEYLPIHFYAPTTTFPGYAGQLGAYEGYYTYTSAQGTDDIVTAWIGTTPSAGGMSQIIATGGDWYTERAMTFMAAGGPGNNQQFQFITYKQGDQYALSVYTGPSNISIVVAGSSGTTAAMIANGVYAELDVPGWTGPHGVQTRIGINNGYAAKLSELYTTRMVATSGNLAALYNQISSAFYARYP